MPPLFLMDDFNGFHVVILRFNNTSIIKMRIILNKHGAQAFTYAFFLPRYWPTWMLLGVLRLAAFLPVRVNFWIGRFLGCLFFHLAASRRHIAQVNIRLCYPELSEKEQQQIVRGVMRSCGIHFMETAMAMWGSAEKFRNRHIFVGGEYLDAAKKEGKGVLLVGSHLTAIDVGARVLTMYHPIDVLYRSEVNPLMIYMQIKARKTYINQTIPRKDTMQLIKNLRRGHIVWYAPDQDYGRKHSVFAPFFGVQAASVAATSRIASMGNALVLSIAYYRDEKGFYRVEIGPPLENFPSEDEVLNATRINQIIEAMIRKAPDQYLWVHRRFKTRPEGAAKVY
jgi:KDO2-lipid IV(A) lauroyltransferase